MMWLTPLSWLYRKGVSFRHYLYDHRILRKQVVPMPVVSIGNVVAGGAGKTQAALMLAEQLMGEAQVAILTRGYKGQAEKGKKPLFVEPAKHGAKLCGDEPLLLASRLSSAYVIVNKNRFKSAQLAEQLGAQLALLDDGMQHRKIHRDFEIVVVDGQTPLTSFLPKGRLREDLSRLKEADLILFVGNPLEEVKRVVSAKTSAPQVIASIAAQGAFYLDGQMIESLQDKAVGVFCGIGDPNRFVKTVEQIGAKVVATHFVSDHQVVSPKALEVFANYAKERGATLLLCTEKDRVKLSQQNLTLPIGWIKAQLQIVENGEAWGRIVGQIKEMAKNYKKVSGEASR